MDVAFEMIHRNQRAIRGEGNGLGEGDADQQRAREARALRDGDRIELLIA